MHKGVSGWLLSVMLLAGFAPFGWLAPDLSHRRDRLPLFSAVLRYNVYTFSVSDASTGVGCELTVRAFRGSLLLTRFQVPLEGPVVRAETADLDGNRFPELYIYTLSTGSGSFGRVYAWQFFSEQLAEIRLAADWGKPSAGYMGHDSLWVDKQSLYRRYPVYRPGDANALPTGGLTTRRYTLKPTGDTYTLVPEP